MRRNYRWYDPISFQFSFSCICSTKDDFSLSQSVYLRFIDELAQLLLWEIEHGRVFQGVTSKAVFPAMRSAEDLKTYISLLHSENQRLWTHASLLSQGFLPRDVISLKDIVPDWRHMVECLTENDLAKNLPASEKKILLQRLINGYSDKPVVEAFPSHCFPPSFTPFYMEIRTMRCQTREEYDVFRESGIIRDEDSSKMLADYRLLAIHVSIPRFWFRGEDVAFPFQNNWTKRLKELCGTHGTSIGSVKADIMYSPIRDHPLYNCQKTFSIGFRSRIGEIGWAMCMSDSQAELLGGLEKLRTNAGFDVVEQVPDEHVYAQLSPKISVIPLSKLVLQWTAIEHHLSVSDHQMHSILDIPISLRLGIQSHNIEFVDDGTYCIHL